MSTEEMFLKLGFIKRNETIWEIEYIRTNCPNKEPRTVVISFTKSLMCFKKYIVAYDNDMRFEYPSDITYEEFLAISEQLIDIQEEKYLERID